MAVKVSTYNGYSERKTRTQGISRLRLFFLSLITDRRARLANFKANIEEREVKVREMVELQKNLESSAFVIL